MFIKENKKRLKLIAGLLLSGLSIIIIIYFVDLKEVWHNLKNLSWHIIICVSLIYLLNILVRTYRWKYIINQKHNISLRLIFKGMVYGYMLNQLLPAKMGEVARAEYLARKNKQGRSFFLGTIAAERIFDMIIISLFLGISVLFSDTIMNKIKLNYIPVFLLLSGFLLMFLLIYKIVLIKKLTHYLPQKHESFVNRIIDNISDSFILFNSFKKIIALFAMSLIIWGLTLLSFYLILSDLEIVLPFYANFFIVSAGTFGMIIPSTSANIGVYHAVAMGALMLFMVSKAQALTFAVVAHAFDFFPSLILGGLLFGYGRIDDLKYR